MRRTRGPSPAGGSLFYYLGRDEAAVADLDRAVALDPKFVKAYSYRERRARAEGRTSWHWHDYNAVVRLMPENAGAYKDRGGVLVRLGRYDTRSRTSTRRSGSTRSGATAYQNRVAACNGLGQYERAIDDLTEAIGLDPENAGAYSNRGLAHFAVGGYDQAIVDLSRRSSSSRARDHSLQPRRGLRSGWGCATAARGLHRCHPACAAPGAGLCGDRPDPVPARPS